MMVIFGTVATLLAAFSPAAATTLLRGASDDPVEALAREQQLKLMVCESHAL